MAKKPHHLAITIFETIDGYAATINDAQVRVKPGHDIKWNVNEPAGFPGDAVVFLQFYEVIDGQKVYSSGCLVDGVKNNGKQPGHKGGANDHRVTGRVGLTSQGSFLYEIRYNDSRGDHLLLDPEIIVEGNPDPPPVGDDQPPTRARRPARPKKRGKAAKKKPAKKKAGKKAGKKKAGKKKAGKSQAAKRRKATKKGKKAKRTAKRRASKKR